MKYVYMLIIMSMLTACATLTPVDDKRERVLACIKDLKAADSSTMDAFEVCRQIFGVAKIKE